MRLICDWKASLHQLIHRAQSFSAYGGQRNVLMTAFYQLLMLFIVKGNSKEISVENGESVIRN